MERNQFAGFVLIALLLVGYLTYNQYEQKKLEDFKKAEAAKNPKKAPQGKDSTAVAAAAAATQAAIPDSVKKLMPPAFNGTSQVVTLENSKVSVQFNTKGAFPVAASLKEYTTYGKKALYLFNGNNNHLTAILPTDNGRSTETLFFTPEVKNDGKGGQSIDFAADMGGGKKVELIYSLPANDYMMQCNVVLTGMTAQELKLNWLTNAVHTEKDINNERLNTQVYYRFKDGDNDYFTVRTGEDKSHESSSATHWVGFRKQYFSTVLISEDGFTHMSTKASMKAEDTTNVAFNQAELMLPLKATGNGTASGAMKWYMGPNDYRTLKAYNMGLDEMVPLGTGIFAFVKYINRGILIPIFYMLSGFISNYAIIIILMTIFIRLILSFFTYKSYLSSAKMRVLKPELDELRAKFGEDQQKMSMEQMKMYRTAGVNPLGGCLPMLFQIPILLSLYNMFPSFIEFRQRGFLWAEDLSTYDSIASWTTNIPFLSSVYGNHISLFTLLMTASSLFLAIYNRNMTPQDPNNPMMKYMPYVFPVILMGWFNKMAAALTFYYTFSNLLSIAQQFIIQKYFIDEKAIHAQIQENRTKGPTTSKWQQRLEEMQKLQAEKAKQPKGGKK